MKTDHTKFQRGFKSISYYAINNHGQEIETQLQWLLYGIKNRDRNGGIIPHTKSMPTTTITYGN